jgi:hypothetical protein
MSPSTKLWRLINPEIRLPESRLWTAPRYPVEDPNYPHNIGKDALFPMWYRKKLFSLDVVSEKTVKFRSGVGIFRYVPFPIPERKLFLTVYFFLMILFSCTFCLQFLELAEKGQENWMEMCFLFYLWKITIKIHLKYAICLKSFPRNFEMFNGNREIHAFKFLNKFPISQKSNSSTQ